VVALTVDDAYLSVYTEAFPRLKALGWPFTVFVATDGIDKGFQAYMSWAQMREMSQHGVTFANHSASHDYLVRRKPGETESQWAVRVREDIQRAQRRLQEELGTAPDLFAYPYGEYDTALATMMQELGFVAFGQHSGAAGLDDDLRALPRFPMAESYADLADFRLKVASLAFPLQRVSPWDPVVNSAAAPRMELILGESSARLSELSCYFSQEGAMQVQWVDRAQRHFAVQGDTDLPLGRSRYNCTAPSAEPGRYYWFSHLWLRQ
jgi:peptidoglycan/xylan/chitin deacetylase (PgdA/CDA1 family)